MMEMPLPADAFHPAVHKEKIPFRSGFVVLIGRPNSGKSTLLNTVIGEELSPVTPLPQTTRRRITGVYTAPSLQIVFIDTPGIHRGGRMLNRAMLGEAENAARDEGIDCLCYIVDLSRDFGEEETLAAAMAEAAGAPHLIVFNKKDLCAAPGTVRERFFSLFPGLAGTPSVTISAVDPKAKEEFLTALGPFITEGPRYFDEETLTDAPLRSLAAEFLRKHLILATRNEVPHAVFVEIESYRELEKHHHDIRAVIHVETTGQRGIIIGRKGALLARIQRAAGAELERLAGCPVRISCHVKVTPHWRDSTLFLRSAHFLSE
jgi:GTP-binding protein Era